jgi:TetR/AcrR family tetracycline transcriptional repressor
VQKRNLTREKICEAAIKLINKQGLENLSMRKLAAELNVEAASIYNHIANKSELFDLVQENLFSKMTAIPEEKKWQDYIANMANSAREGLLQIPNVVPLFATRPTITNSALAQAEKTFEILIKAGFKPSEVGAIYRNIYVFILGHVLAEVGRVPGEADNQNEPSLTKINIDQYPILKKSYSYKSNLDFDKGFKMGLTSLICGLEKLRKRKKT